MCLVFGSIYDVRSCLYRVRYTACTVRYRPRCCAPAAAWFIRLLRTLEGRPRTDGRAEPSNEECLQLFLWYHARRRRRQHMKTFCRNRLRCQSNCQDKSVFVFLRLFAPAAWIQLVWPRVKGNKAQAWAAAEVFQEGEPNPRVLTKNFGAHVLKIAWSRARRKYSSWQLVAWALANFPPWRLAWRLIAIVSAIVSIGCYGCQSYSNVTYFVNKTFNCMSPVPTDCYSEEKKRCIQASNSLHMNNSSRCAKT